MNANWYGKTKLDDFKKLGSWVTPRYVFDDDMIDKKAPEEAGVYVCFKDDVLIYIGESEASGKKTSNIKERLLDHADPNNTVDHPLLKEASHFNYKTTDKSKAEPEEKRLIDKCEKAFGKAPECNRDAHDKEANDAD